MRKRLAILLALSLTAIMSFGIIGSGAAFLYEGTANQDIQIGSLDFDLSSTDGAVSGDSVTCDVLAVNGSSNWTFAPVHACNVTLTTTGDISAAISVFAHVDSGTTLAASSLDSFVLYPSANPSWLSGGTAKPLNTPNVDPAWGFGLGIVNSPAMGNSVSFDFSYDWGQGAGTDELVNADMGKIIKVTFTFSASA